MAHSDVRKQYLARIKRRAYLIKSTQWLILIGFIFLWELGARLGWIDDFIVSSPSRMLQTILNFQNNGIFFHMGVTLLETLIGFTLGIALGIFIAFILWYSSFLAKVMDPYLVILNALPKIALGPVIIIWVGAGMQAIIVMALAISLIVTILEMLTGFNHTQQHLLKMATTFGASKWQSFTKIVFPSNLHTLFNCIKINLGLTLVGVIAGEFLVSRHGLGYLIVFGGQVFQMDLVMTSVVLLGMMAAGLGRLITLAERVVKKKFNV